VASADRADRADRANRADRADPVWNYASPAQAKTPGRETGRFALEQLTANHFPRPDFAIACSAVCA
jgi:hypothetical protein